MSAGAATDGPAHDPEVLEAPETPTTIAAALFLLRLSSHGLAAAQHRGDDGAVRVLREEIDGLLGVLSALLEADARDREVARLVIDWVRSGEPRAIPAWPTQASAGSS